SAPSQTTTDAGGRVPQPGAAAEPTIPDARWEDLIELREAEGARGTAPEAAPARRPPWVGASVAVGLVILGFLAAMLAGAIRVKPRDGVIVVEGVPMDAEVLVDGHEITVTRPGVGKPVVVRAVPGERQVEVKADGFQAFGEVVTVKAGGTQEVRVRLEPLA